MIIDDKLIEFDNIISNVDINLTHKKLLNNSNYSCNKENMSSSAIIFFWGINREFKDLDLHNVLFSKNYKEEFKNIFEKNDLYHDPTIYINITSKDLSLFCSIIGNEDDIRSDESKELRFIDSNVFFSFSKDIK